MRRRHVKRVGALAHAQQKRAPVSLALDDEEGAALDWDDGVTALYLAEVCDDEGRALASAQLNVHRGEARKLTP